MTTSDITAIITLLDELLPSLPPASGTGIDWAAAAHSLIRDLKQLQTETPDAPPDH